jgi:hypothetical protein
VLTIHLSNRCWRCIRIKDWIDAHPMFIPWVVYSPPLADNPILPSVIYKGKKFTKPSKIIALLDEINNTPEMFNELLKGSK